MFPAAVVEIGLAVVIDESVGVDGLSAVDVFFDEGFAEGILEWPGGGFGGSDADAGSIASREVFVIGAVSFDNTGGPCGAVG